MKVFSQITYNKGKFIQLYNHTNDNKVSELPEGYIFNLSLVDCYLIIVGC
jgi:hypothetical protein